MQGAISGKLQIPQYRVLSQLSCKEFICQCRRQGFDLWVRKIPWRRKWQPTPVFLPGKFHGQRSLAGYSPGSHKESDMTERLRTCICVCIYVHTHTHIYIYIYLLTYVFLKISSFCFLKKRQSFSFTSLLWVISLENQLPGQKYRSFAIHIIYYHSVLQETEVKS